MSGFSGNQPDMTGTGQPNQQYQPQIPPQAQAPYEQGPVTQQAYQQTNFPPPPPGPPPSNTTEHNPIPPPRPTGDAPHSTYVPSQSNQYQPTTSEAFIICARCSYHNPPSMPQCEMCEAELKPPTAPRPPMFAPPPGSAHHPQHTFGQGPDASRFAPPPKRATHHTWADDDPGNPTHYARDPHKLVAYIIPLPTPILANAPTDDVPRRFLIYTPPPPPLKKPTLAPGEKEEKMHLVQRKWQDEVRKAKNSTEKTTSLKGIHHKMVRGTNKAMALTTSANLDFLGRAGGGSSPGRSRPSTPEQQHADDGVQVNSESTKTVPVDEMIFIYPESMGTNEQALREEFINTLMRTKSKAQRDSVIATGLVPVGFGIDFLLVVVGGLGEIATVWAFKSIMGAKTARSISKRLASAESNQGGEGQLKLNFKPSGRLEVLKNYLEAECNRVDPVMFPRSGQYHIPPTEGQVLDAIGWSPAQSDGETKNWEDEKWELDEVKEDFRVTMHKGAKEWKKWCSNYEKEWEKKIKKERGDRNETKYQQG